MVAEITNIYWLSCAFGLACWQYSLYKLLTYYKPSIEELENQTEYEWLNYIKHRTGDLIVYFVMGVSGIVVAILSAYIAKN